MNTTRLIARFLQWKAQSLRKRYWTEALFSFGVGAAVIVIQFFFYFVCLWFCAGFSPSPAPEILLAVAMMFTSLQFVAYLGCGNSYREPRSDLHTLPALRLIMGGFFLVGPQMVAEGAAALMKAQRVDSIDVENCANVLYTLMKEHDAITFQQVWDVIDRDQSVNRIVDQLCLYPGVIVQANQVKLTPSLRIEVAEFCRHEKSRIRESVAVDEMDKW